MGLGLSEIRIIAFCALFATFSCFPLLAQESKDAKQSTLDVMQDDADFDALHEQFLAEDGLQFERPVPELEEVEIPEPKPRSNFKLPDWLLKFLGSLGPVMQILFYVGVGTLAAFVLYYIIGAFTQVDLKDLRKKKQKTNEADDVLAASLQPDAVAARSLLEEADALAKEGKFAEAVHLLLFRSIEDIQTRRKKRISTALTAREIGELDDLPAKPRAALNPIITIVERSFFGGQDVDETGWQDARKAYENFAFGETWT